MDTGLRDKTVILTGGASGIGASTARILAAEGARLVLVDIDGNNLREIQDACGDIAEANAAEVVQADLSTAVGVSNAMGEAIQVLDGRVDVLINNVGTGYVRTFDQIDDEAWQATFDLNFMSYVRAIRQVLPVMRQQGSGAIVNNASDLARQPEANPIDYAASKAAVLAVTKGLARSEGPGIRINAVAPGPVWTPFWTKPGGFAETMGEYHQMPPQEAVEHEMKLRALPMERLGEPDEVARVIVFLASELASFVTSSVWGVDGGSIRNII